MSAFPPLVALSGGSDMSALAPLLGISGVGRSNQADL